MDNTGDWIRNIWPHRIVLSVWLPQMMNADLRIVWEYKERFQLPSILINFSGGLILISTITPPKVSATITNHKSQVKLQKWSYYQFSSIRKSHITFGSGALCNAGIWSKEDLCSSVFLTCPQKWGSRSMQNLCQTASKLSYWFLWLPMSIGTADDVGTNIDCRKKRPEQNSPLGNLSICAEQISLIGWPCSQSHYSEIIKKERPDIKATITSKTNAKIRLVKSSNILQFTGYPMVICFRW